MFVKNAEILIAILFVYRFLDSFKAALQKSMMLMIIISPCLIVAFNRLEKIKSLIHKCAQSS